MTLKARILVYMAASIGLLLVILTIAMVDFTHFDHLLTANAEVLDEAAAADHVRAHISLIARDTAQANLSGAAPPRHLAADLRRTEADVRTWRRATLSDGDARIHQVQDSVDAALKTDRAALSNRTKPAAASFAALGDDLDVYVASLDHMRDQRDQKIEAFQRVGLHRILLGVVAAATLLVGGIFWVMTIRITGPLQQVSAMILRLAQGDLDIEPPVQPSRKDEISDLMNALGILIQHSRQAKSDAEQLEILRVEREHRLRAIFID
ncbi:MAG: HAMP domain-containing protein [Asticcacaulis sp.]|uniref:HAMP domain-containing protein n=1 Tax=Asticcacaulis sp. TaxID=1872648 RepID=UPI003F7CB1A4